MADFFNKDRFDEKIRHCRDMGSTPMEIKSNHAVIASYLGVEESNATFQNLRDASLSYGRVEALREVSFSVNAGEIVMLIAANGAGKSTLLMTILGGPQ